MQFFADLPAELVFAAASAVPVAENPVAAGQAEPVAENLVVAGQAVFAALSDGLFAGIDFVRTDVAFPTGFAVQIQNVDIFQSPPSSLNAFNAFVTVISFAA